MSFGWDIIKRFSETDNSCFSYDDVKVEFEKNTLEMLDFRFLKKI